VIGADLLTAFSLGLLGSGHCIAMCGGISGALSMRAGAAGARGQDAVLAVPLYSAGRIGSYAVLGAVAGGIGGAATALIPELLGTLRLVAGGLLVAMGLYLAGLWNGLVRLERLGAGLFARVSPLRRHLAGPLEPLGLGLLWGLLPCGLVYSTLAFAMTHASALQGAAVMTAFGLGTLPAVVGAGFAAVPLGRALRRPLVRRAAGALVIAFGLWTLAFPGPAVGGAQHSHHAQAGSPVGAAPDHAHSED
jgi:sulfite exporter TauE/SafE